MAEPAREVAAALDVDFRSASYSDVVITAHDGETPVDFYAHRFILSQRSPVFRAAIEANPPDSPSIVDMSEHSSKVVAKLLRFLYTGKVDTMEDMAEARDLNQLAVEHGLNHLRVECEVAIARGFPEPCANAECSTAATSENRTETADSGDRGSFSESFEVVDAIDSQEIQEAAPPSQSPSLPPSSSTGGEGGELPSNGSGSGSGSGVDDDAETLRDATNAAARLLVRDDLASYLAANPGPRGSFVGWIASLHPENVHLDSRMWIEGNDWLEAWRAAKGEHPKGMRAATLHGVATAEQQKLVTDSTTTPEAEISESAEVGQTANFATEWPPDLEGASAVAGLGSSEDGANEEEGSDDEGEALLLRSSTQSASGAKANGAGDKAKSVPTTLESFFRGWGRNSLNSNDKAAAAAAAAAAATTAAMEEEYGENDSTTAVTKKKAHPKDLKNSEGSARDDASDSSSGEEDEDDDDGGHLDPRVEKALSAYTSAVAEHNALTAAAHACSDREAERRQVVERAAEDLKLELLRLRPVLLPLERAKQRLRLVLEALDQRNNSNNDNGGGGGGQPDENTCVQQQHTAGSARESPAVPSTPPPILPRTEVPLPPSPAVLDALKLAEEAERQEELSKVARSQELDQSNSNRSSDSSHRSSSGSREQHHDNVEGIREEAPKTPVSARQESRSDEHLSAKTATSSSSSSSPSTTAAVVDGVTAPTSSGKESSNFPQEDAEVEAAMAMEHVRCLTESLCEESLRHHDLEVSLDTLERERGRLEVQADTRRRELLASKDWVTTRFAAVERVSKAQMSTTTSSVATTSQVPPMSTGVATPAAAALANHSLVAPHLAPFSPTPAPPLAAALPSLADPAAMLSTSAATDATATKENINEDVQQPQVVNFSGDTDETLVTPPRPRPPSFPYSTYTPGTPAPELRVAVDLEVRLDLLEASLRQEDQRLLSVEQRIHALHLTATAPLTGSPGRARRRRSSGSSSNSYGGSDLSPAELKAAAAQREAAMVVAAAEEQAWVLAEASRLSAWENMRLAACYTLGRSGYRRDDAAAVDALLRAAQQFVIAADAAASTTAAALNSTNGAGFADAASTAAGGSAAAVVGADASDALTASSDNRSVPPAAAKHAMALLGLRALLGVGVRRDASSALQWFGAAASGDDGDAQAMVHVATLLAEPTAHNSTDNKAAEPQLPLPSSSSPTSSEDHRIRSIPLPQLPQSTDNSTCSSATVGGPSSTARADNLVSIASTAAEGAGAVASWMKVQPATHPWRCARVTSYWLMAASRGSVPEAIFRIGLLFETGSLGFDAKDLQSFGELGSKHPIEGSTNFCSKSNDSPSSSNIRSSPVNPSSSSSASSQQLWSLPPAVVDMLLACEGDQWLTTLREELSDLAPYERDECQAAARYSAAAKMGHSQAAHRLAVMYETGRGGKLPQDSALAAAYFSIAASHGDRDAQRALDMRYTASAKIPSALSPSSSAKNSSSSSSTSSAASSHDGRSKSEQLPLSNCNDNNIDANVDLDESDDADALEASWQIAAAIQLADAANQAGSGIDHHDQSSTSNSSSSDSIKIAGGDSAGSQRTVAAADRPSFAASLLAPRAKKQVPPAASSTSHPPAPAESSKGKRGSGSALGWFSAKPKS